MSNNHKFIKNSILFSFVFLALSVTSQEIEEVVVTATKKEESLQDVAIAIDAFTGEDTWSTFTMKNPTTGGEAFKLIHNAVEKMVCDYQDYLDTFNAFHVMRRVSLMYPHMYRIMKYDTGAWIHPHVDHDPEVYGSCTINLNDEYTGGDFAFWGGKHKVKLEKGDAMIWPADYYWVHEVEEIMSGFRYSVNCFLRSTPLTLSEENKFDVWVPDNMKKFVACDGNRPLGYK